MPCHLLDCLNGRVHHSHHLLVLQCDQLALGRFQIAAEVGFNTLRDHGLVQSRPEDNEISGIASFKNTNKARRGCERVLAGTLGLPSASRAQRPRLLRTLCWRHEFLQPGYQLLLSAIVPAPVMCSGADDT